MTLRRTCARLCHGCGGELEQIQFLLGQAVSRLLCKRPSVFFESFFVPVKQPVAGAVGMWESRIFCEIPKELWKAWCWLSIAPSFPQLCSEFSCAILAQAVIHVHLPACDPATEC